LDPARRTPAATNPRPGSERRLAQNFLPMVSRNDAGRASTAQGGGIEVPAPGLLRSPTSGYSRKLLDMLLGVVGAILAGWLFNIYGISGVTAADSKTLGK